MVGNFSALRIIMSGNDGAGHITRASQTGLSDSILGEHLHTRLMACGLWLATPAQRDPRAKPQQEAQILINLLGNQSHILHVLKMHRDQHLAWEQDCIKTIFSFDSLPLDGSLRFNQ